MTRVLLRVLAAVVLAGVLVVPALATMVDTSSSGVADPVTISLYRAEYRVDADGDLTATETITAQFPGGRHGIFRYWDVADVADTSVRYRPHDVSIRLDGQAVPVEALWEQGRRFRVAKIGDPDQYLTEGLHTYTIRYRIDGVLAPNPERVADESSSWTGGDDDRSEFVWQVVAAGWSMPIARADITVDLPAATDRLECSIGDGRRCEVGGEGSTRVTLTAADLPPNTAVVVRAAMDEPAPDRAHVPWSIGWDRMLGARWWPFLASLALAALAFLAGYLLDRASRERQPGFPVVFEPPQGLGPVQTAFIVDERVPRRALTATLMHLAEQGHIELTESGGVWTVVSRLDPQTREGLDPVAQRVISGLDLQTAGATFRADGSVSAGAALGALQGQLAGVTSSWGTSSGATETAGREWIWRGLLVISLAIVAIGTFFGMVGIWLLPFAAFAVGAIGLLLRGVGSRRTATGRDLWSRAGGFERFLSTDASKDRFDFSGREQLYTSFIPYAVAFDVADRWARKYETSTSQSAPMPLWYAGGTHSSGTGFFGGGDAFSSFENAMTSSISAYNATQSSSSSGGGGGGGGFSGGGGGGGGGGSW